MHERTITVPKDRHASFMLAGSAHDLTRKSVTIDDVSGDQIDTARFTVAGWAEDRGETRTNTVTLADDGSAIVSSPGPYGPFVMQADPANLALAGRRSLSVAVSKARANGETKSLAAALALALSADLGEAPIVTVAGPRRRGPLDVYALTARGRREIHATCHGLSESTSLTGELSLRARDGALVALHLRGEDELVEDTCSPDGQGRMRSAAEPAILAVTISRPCFET